MPNDLIDLDAFRTLARAEPGASSHVYRVSTSKPKSLDDGRRKIRFCFSDGSVDRMGDTIEASGWKLNSFNNNPVALWAHDSSAPPVGRASRVLVEDARLMGDIEFASADVYPFADTIYKLTVAGFLNAVSVGFIPLKYNFVEDESRPWGMNFTSQELLEISVCPVPANGNALIEARAKGIDTRPLIEWAERTLDGGGKTIIPRSELESLRKSAAELKTLKPKKRADDSGMSETDPAAGGAVVATCARTKDEACGLSNPLECSVHMTDAADEKRIAGIVRRAVRSQMKLAQKSKSGRVHRSDQEPDADDDTLMKPEHEANIRAAAEHLEDMGESLDDAADHHEKAMELLNSVCDDLDTDPEDETGADPAQSDEKAARAARRLRRSLAQARANSAT